MFKVSVFIFTRITRTTTGQNTMEPTWRHHTRPLGGAWRRTSHDNLALKTRKTGIESFIRQSTHIQNVYVNELPNIDSQQFQTWRLCTWHLINLHIYVFCWVNKIWQSIFSWWIYVLLCSFQWKKANQNGKQGSKKLKVKFKYIQEHFLRETTISKNISRNSEN